MTQNAALNWGNVVWTVFPLLFMMWDNIWSSVLSLYGAASWCRICPGDRITTRCLRVASRQERDMCKLQQVIFTFIFYTLSKSLTFRVKLSITYEISFYVTVYLREQESKRKCSSHDKSAVVFLSNFSIKHNFSHFLHAILRLFCALIDARYIIFDAATKKFVHNVNYTLWLDEFLPTSKFDIWYIRCTLCCLHFLVEARHILQPISWWVDWQATRICSGTAQWVQTSDFWRKRPGVTALVQM